MSVTEGDKSDLTLDQFNQIDRSTRFKAAQREEDDSRTLLAFYRDRIKAFDREREEWLQKLEQLTAVKKESLYEASELQRKREEVADLQRSISEAKISLHNEREQKLKLLRESDSLKLTELENRKKIYELMVLNDPREKENAFYRDLRPEIKSTMKNDLSIQLNKRSNNTKEEKAFAGTVKNTKMTNDVLKTIYLPNEQINTIAIENENLKRRLREEEIAHAEQIDVLREELRIREEEHFNRQEADLDRIQELADKNKRLETYKSLIAKEYFSLRLQVNERKQKLQGENEILKINYEGLSQKMNNHERKVEVEYKIAAETLGKKSEEYSQKYQNTIRQKDEALIMVKEQYAQIQKSYLTKLQTIEENLANLANKYQTLEKRRMIENEDFKAETKDLEKRLKQFERRYFKVDNTKTQFKDRIKGFVGDQRDEEGDEDIHDETLEDEEDESLANTINSEEFSLIKRQLADLESKLDKSKKREEPFKF